MEVEKVRKSSEEDTRRSFHIMGTVIQSFRKNIIVFLFFMTQTYVYFV